MEYEYAQQYRKLPEGARFLQSVEVVVDKDGDENCLFVWRNPSELRSQ